MNEDLERSVPNVWRNTPRWPQMGVGAVAVDARVPLAWLLAIPFDVMGSIAKYVTVYFVAKLVLRIKAGWEGAYFRTKLNGKRISGLGVRNVTGLLTALFAVVLLTAPIGEALADFSIIVPERKASAREIGADGGIPQDSTVPLSLDQPVRSFGHDMRLEDAVNLVIPGDIAATFSDNELKEKRVSWRSEDLTPRDVLYILASQAQANFSVDDRKGRVHFAAIHPGYRMRNLRISIGCR